MRFGNIIILSVIFCEEFHIFLSLVVRRHVVCTNPDTFLIILFFYYKYPFKLSNVQKLDRYKSQTYLT